MLKEAPSETHAALEGTHLGRPELVAIRRRYNLKVTSYSVIAKNAGSVWKGKLWKIEFTDSYSNGHMRLVYYLSVIFKLLNHVRKYDQA